MKSSSLREEDNRAAHSTGAKLVSENVDASEFQEVGFCDFPLSMETGAEKVFGLLEAGGL